MCSSNRVGRLAAAGNMESVGHRVKRIKTENSATIKIVSRLEVKKRATRSRSAQTNENVEIESVANEEEKGVPGASSVTTPLSQANSSAVQDSVHVNVAEMKSKSDTSQDFSYLGAGATSPEPADAVNIDIDFSAAPSDPLDLSFWVAHQIRRYAVADVSSSDAASASGRDNSRSRRSSQSHPPGRRIREKIDRGVDATTVADPDKTRDGNRKRKQSWRNAHLERSTS